MSDRSFVDTNVLVYAVDDADPAKRDAAREILGDPVRAASLVVSTQVLAEFYAVVTRRLETPLPAAEAERAVHRLSGLAVASLDAGTVTAAVSRAAVGGISIWDSLIVQAAIESGCAVLLSEDLQDGALIDGVRVENPFRDAGAEGR